MAIACSPSVFLREEEDYIDYPFERPYIVQSLAPTPNSLPRRGLPLEIQKEFKVDRINSVVDYIKAKLKEDNDLDESFYVCNFGAIIEQLEQWERLLPRVQPFYAMKCNPSQPIVRILAAMGTGFDCASAEEIMIAKELNVPNSKIIFANPCKSKINILKAREEGIKMMTFDNVDELRKVHRLFPEAEMVLRILPDDSHSLMKFGTKFGAPSESWEELFTEANKLGIKIVGVSFHVGSGCFDAIAYAHALSLARSCFDMASTYGFDFTLLDIGGGFPGSTDTSLTFPEIADVLRPTLDELFPASQGVKIIAEPGRYFAQACITLATSIHSKRAYREGDGSKCFKYYVGDGVYGSFNCIMFDHANPKPCLLRDEIPADSSSESESDEERVRYSSTIFGPTCDSMDRIVNQTLLPELAVGEWIFFENMGAYTTAAASSFNGFHSPSSFYVLENTSLS